MFISSIPVPVTPVHHYQTLGFMAQSMNQSIIVFEEDGEVKALYKGGVHPALALLDTYPSARFVAFLTDLPHQFYVYAALHVQDLVRLIVFV